mmetsp:Transcript_31117/g.74489  ORF Transcript_31117/g.74489 Transcript_31117/m.74489 type:complete len:229 (-) Transcript_31117:1039-1725(-)
MLIRLGPRPRGAHCWVRLLHIHTLVVSAKLLPNTVLRIRGAPGVVHAGISPDLRWWCGSVDTSVDCKPRVWSVESNWHLVGRAGWVRIKPGMEEPFHVVVHHHLFPLLPAPVNQVLDPHLDPAQIHRALREGTVLPIDQVRSQHRHAHRVRQTCASTQVLAEAQQTVEQRDHRSCVVAVALLWRLQMNLRHQAMIQPSVFKIIIERIMTQLLCRGVITHVVPHSGSDL